ncbi:MAG TPA: hypothetical protein VK050_06435 [Flavobacteriaceae bacterium]|nr:hypothetical protein [Flavobacteriaceae bacterium]
MKRIPQKDLIDYEISSSWWAGAVKIGWMQRLSGKYFAWKTIRKYKRYLYAIERRNNNL